MTPRRRRFLFDLMVSMALAAALGYAVRTGGRVRGHSMNASDAEIKAPLTRAAQIVTNG